ncbi:hypothetical protein EV121DRAFT_284484 [Schizophyllum commune]
MHAPRTHIPQPPHTAGERYKGLRQRIDPAQIPSPIDNQARDDAEWTTLSPTTPTSKPFLTLPGSGRPPLATTLSAHPQSPACLDQGNAAPRFVRLTTWNFPNCARLAKECHIPLAAHFQPFADQPAGEEPVPLVPFNPSTTPTPSGPPRCARCRAYINPWRGGAISASTRHPPRPTTSACSTPTVCASTNNNGPSSVAGLSISRSGASTGRRGPRRSSTSSGWCTRGSMRGSKVVGRTRPPPLRRITDPAASFPPLSVALALRANTTAPAASSAALPHPPITPAFPLSGNLNR